MTCVHSPQDEAHTQSATGPAVVGQWAVVKGLWRDEVAEITKVSAKQVRTRRHGDREAHHPPSEIVFVGTEKQARDLHSVLKGLDDRHERNRQQLIAQHRASRAAAIRKATTALNADSVGTDERSEGVTP